MTSAEAYLRRFHGRQPGATAAGLGRGRTRAGKSSYDLLVERMPENGRVLDLGCGDATLLGRLSGARVGVDLSLGELRHGGDADALLLQARADALPFANATFDVVVSHLALMLMPLEATLREARRVLSNGARLLAVVQSDLPPQGAFAEFAMRLGAGIREAPELADARASDREAMDVLLAEAGFTATRFTDAILEFAPEDRRPLFESLYGLDLVDDATRAHALKAEGDDCRCGVRIIETTAA